jgi:hypothetical protein
MVQSIPTGCDVTRPLPFPPGTIAMLPFANWKGVHTVMIEWTVVPPAVAMIIADWLLVTVLVETVKVALVDPAGTETLGGTVAAAVLSLDNATPKPPGGAADVRVTVPVAGSPPTTSVGSTRSAESDGADAGGGELTVQPDKVAVVGVAEPSFTATVQLAGVAKGSLWILKLPAASLVPMATPSTVIVRLGIAVPSRRSLVPMSSAREMRTSASAVDTAAIAPTTARKLISTTQARPRAITSSLLVDGSATHK